MRTASWTPLRRLTLGLLTLAPGAVGCGDKAGGGGSEVETDRDGDGYDAEAHGGSDCDDDDPNVHISSPEVCNDIDDNCDGEVDNNAADAELVYVDADVDGYGVGADSMRACGVPPGYTATHGDCDDTLAAVNEGAAEACDGVDTDCDGEVGADEVDSDGDGYPGCEIAAHGWLGEHAFTDSDCDDVRASVHPGATETCDGFDTDCDGALSDEEADLDGDGFNRCSEGDCDDDDAARHPVAIEDCSDSVDQDCDDLLDCQDGDCDADILCEELCDNGRDDDSDGLTDCEDGECALFEACIEVCDDGADNDMDGLTDCQDFDDCAGTEPCPVSRQVNIAGGDFVLYAVHYGRHLYHGFHGMGLSGTVATFDSAASAWKSCNWAMGSVSFNTVGTVGTVSSSFTMRPVRRDGLVTGSCDLTAISSYLPRSLRVRAGTSSKNAVLTYTTALGDTAAPWYKATGPIISIIGGSYRLWYASGAVEPQTFWTVD